MNKMQEQVKAFRLAMDLPVASRPRALDEASAQRHVKMIRDEFEKEFVPAILSGDIVEFYDAAIDVIVYIVGATLDSGMDVDPGLDEVFLSNMSKLDPETGKAIKAGFNDPSGEPEGKVLKGPNYFKPKLKELLESGAADAGFGDPDGTDEEIAAREKLRGEIIDRLEQLIWRRKVTSKKYSELEDIKDLVADI